MSRSLQNNYRCDKETITVLIADPDKMRCKLMTTGLKRSRYNFRIIGSATDSSDAFDLFRGHGPDVALISSTLRDGECSGVSLLRRIHVERPATRTLLLTDSFDRNLTVDAFRLGADGVFNRDQPFEALCKAIYVVSRGEVWINHQEVRWILDTLQKEQPASARILDTKGQQLLSKRQEEIVALVAQGRSNREVSEILHLSEHTVKNYMLRIFDKLGVSSRVELILYVVSRGGDIANRDTGSVSMHSDALLQT